MTRVLALVAAFAGAAVLPTTTAAGQRILRTHVGDASYQKLGSAVAPTGDLDGDGIGDYLAAAMGDGANQELGYVRLFSSRDGSTIHTLRGGALNEDFAASACGIGDLNADGTPDVLIGIPLRQGGNHLGEVVAYSGQTGFPIRSYSVANKRRFGTEVRALGDVDGDRVDDFVTLAATDREALLISGATGLLLRTSTAGGWTSSRRGSLAVAGDLDGDGFPDYVAGEPRTGGGSVNEVWAYSGRTGAQLHHFARDDGSLFGISVAGAGDVDNDGRDDFIVGAETDVDPATGFGQGSITVYSGSSGAILHRVYGDPSLPSRFGASVAGVGDLNRDGFDDFAGASTRFEGYVQVFSGSNGSLMTTVRGLRDGTAFGDALARIADLDGDGRDELVVGAWADYLPLVQRGSVFVYSTRIEAATTVLGTGCGGGPFVPELGATRPLLGRTATIVGRDVPAGAAGVLLLGPPLRIPVNLGFPACDVFVEVGAALPIPVPAGPQWSLPVLVPAVDVLAGVHFAMEAVYGPTIGSLGFDLSNGLLWRLGD